MGHGRFPPPWSVERRATAKLLSRDGGWSQDRRDPTACAIAVRCTRRTVLERRVAFRRQRSRFSAVRRAPSARLKGFRKGINVNQGLTFRE
jgi:hypothetical protein